MGQTPHNSVINSLRHREPAAVQTWFERHADTVYTFVYYRVGRDEDLASDVVQETFLQALTQIEKYDPNRGTMEAWLTTLSRNHITRALKSCGRLSADQHWRQVDECLLNAYQRIATEPLPPEVLQQQETEDLVRMTLASIPGNYRTVLEMFYHRGLSLKDIAAQCKKSEGAVKVLLHRARLAFKEAFLQLGDTALGEGGTL
jgi:RNA polymerase sigma factor (sigma-70 family)